MEMGNEMQKPWKKRKQEVLLLLCSLRNLLMKILSEYGQRNWFVYVGMVFDGILMETESSSSPDCITGFVLFCSTTREPVTQILFINIIARS